MDRVRAATILLLLSYILRARIIRETPKERIVLRDAIQSSSNRYRALCVFHENGLRDSFFLSLFLSHTLTRTNIYTLTHILLTCTNNSFGIFREWERANTLGVRSRPSNRSQRLFKISIHEDEGLTNNRSRFRSFGLSSFYVIRIEQINNTYNMHSKNRFILPSLRRINSSL